MFMYTIVYGEYSVWFRTYPQYTNYGVYVVNRASGLGHAQWTDGVYVPYIVKKMCGLGHTHNGLMMAFKWHLSALYSE